MQNKTPETNKAEEQKLEAAAWRWGEGRRRGPRYLRLQQCIIKKNNKWRLSPPLRSETEGEIFHVSDPLTFKWTVQAPRCPRPVGCFRPGHRAVLGTASGGGGVKTCRATVSCWSTHRNNNTYDVPTAAGIEKIGSGVSGNFLVCSTLWLIVLLIWENILF